MLMEAETFLMKAFASVPNGWPPFLLMPVLPLLGCVSLLASVVGCFFVRKRPRCLFALFVCVALWPLLCFFTQRQGGFLFSGGLCCIVLSLATGVETVIRKLGRRAGWLSAGALLFAVGLLFALAVIAQMFSVSSGPCPRPPSRSQPGVEAGGDS